METSINRVISRADRVPAAVIADGVLVIDREAGFCYALNSTSARIWELLAQPQPIGLLCEKLSSEFEVDPANCLHDVSAVLQEMEKAGLVR